MIVLQQDRESFSPPTMAPSDSVHSSLTSSPDRDVTADALRADDVSVRTTEESSAVIGQDSEAGDDVKQTKDSRRTSSIASLRMRARQCELNAARRRADESIW